MHDAVFNTFRRTRAQILYWVPPMLAAYYVMNWATERYVLLPFSPTFILFQCLTRNLRNHYLNSKAGRAEFKDEE